MTSCPLIDVAKLKKALDGLQNVGVPFTDSCQIGGQHGGVGGLVTAVGLIVGALVAVHPDQAGNVLGGLAYGGCKVYQQLGKGSGIKSLESYEPGEPIKGNVCAPVAAMVQVVAQNTFTIVHLYESLTEIVSLVRDAKYDFARTKMTNFTKELEENSNEPTPNKPTPWTPFVPFLPNGQVTPANRWTPPTWIPADPSYPPPPPNNQNQNAFGLNNEAYRGEENNNRIPHAAYVGPFPLVAAALAKGLYGRKAPNQKQKPSKRSTSTTNKKQSNNPFNITANGSSFSFFESDEHKYDDPIPFNPNWIGLPTGTHQLNNGSIVSSLSHNRVSPLTNAQINQKIKNNAKQYKREQAAKRPPPPPMENKNNSIPNNFSNFGKPFNHGGKRRTKRRSVMRKKRTQRRSRSARKL